MGRNSLDMIEKGGLCVLATTGEAGPRASLMAFAYCEKDRTLILATARDSTKFRNLVRTPAVSLLVDDRREGANRPLSAIRALTLAGEARVPETPEEQEEKMALFLARHPDLSDLAEKEAFVTVAVHVQSLLLLNGPGNAEFSDFLPDHQTREKTRMKNLREYFNANKGMGVLSTAGADGSVNAAVFAAPHFLEDGLLGFIMPDRLTRKNLKENGKAHFLFRQDGKGYQGVRLSLVLEREEEDREKIASLRRRTSKEPDGSPRFLLCFSVTRILPLIGSGDEDA